MGGMEIAALVLEYVKALAWPLVVLGLALIFRSELRDLVDRIRIFKGLGFEAQLAEKLSRVAATAEKIEKESGVRVKRRKAVKEPGASPLERILSAWSDLEVLSYEVSRNRGENRPVTNVAQLFRALHRDGLVSEDLVGVARGLQGIRNDIVHRPGGVNLIGEFVDEFIDTTLVLCEALEALLDRPTEKVS